MNWFAVKNTSTGAIVAYTSDNAQGYGSLKAGLQYVGPYATQHAAQTANDPVYAAAVAANATVKTLL